jgi:hypothetical protein
MVRRGITRKREKEKRRRGEEEIISWLINLRDSI